MVQRLNRPQEEHLAAGIDMIIEFHLLGIGRIRTCNRHLRLTTVLLAAHLANLSLDLPTDLCAGMFQHFR